MESLRAMAAACAQQAEACDAHAAVPSGAVSLSSGGTFNAGYEWFQQAMETAKQQPEKARAAMMQATEARLDADLEMAKASPAPAGDFSAARRKADAILAGREFAIADQESPWERLLEWIFLWLDRALTGVAAFGSRSPWIAPLMEWGLGGLAAALLLAWIFRSVRQQRQRLKLEAERPLEAAEERVLNWQHEAEENAARGEYREAVHCLYWASIATLEGRRLWRPDRARTPREYLRLLDGGSAAAGLLRRQMLSFETIWYGLRPARQADYEQALRLHRELRSA